MAKVLGWKDILRPIRDGYRHLFPTPDTGPTPEQRQKQREADRLKGFTYFDTLEQLQSWAEEDSEPYQRANTPLLLRNNDPSKADLGKAPVLLVHDYAGNYHEYENSRTVQVKEESYVCEYLQYIDTFVYFSHKLVCVPPPSWTNALHRNGVQTLGTLIFEPQTDGLDQLLEYTDHEGHKDFRMASILTRIAKHYGFEGWLVNIEKAFPNDHWNPGILEEFLNQLRVEMGENSAVIWYDALTATNKISYQNTLNDANISFAAASGGILTNYCWTEKHAEEALSRASLGTVALDPSQVFFGIDVWAQNTSKLSQPRVTYPEFGGGGTNTGVAVAKLASLGLSAGIFAPAWTFEHFPGLGRNVEKTVWEGTDLPEDAHCDCGDCEKRHSPNKQSSIIAYAREFSAGSDRFFYTDFCRAFDGDSGVETAGLSDHPLYAQLSAQSTLPIPSKDRDRSDAPTLTHRLKNAPGCIKLLIEARGGPFEVDIRGVYRLPLYKLDMPNDGSLQVQAKLQTQSQTGGSIEICLYVRSDKDDQIWPIPEDENIQCLREVIGLTASGARINEIGVLLRGSLCLQLSILPLLDIFEICVLPYTTSRPLDAQVIETLYMERRQQSAIVIGWTYKDTMSRNPSIYGMPYSNTTGPFAYFRVVVEGLDLGRVYALEVVLPDHLANLDGNDSFAIDIEGFGFDGRILARSSGTLWTMFKGTELPSFKMVASVRDVGSG